MHTSDQWRQQGNAAFGVDDFRQAVEYYSNALTCLEIMESAVGVHILLSNRSAAHLQLFNYQQALADADAALQLEPTFAKALYRRALALEGLQQCSDALETILAAQNHLPRNVQVQAAVGRMRKAALAAEQQAASAASSQLVQAEPIETEAPEDVHLTKRIKLQKGWLYQPSPDGVDENLLILLHGYGDTPEPYARLARQMALPQTACLALPGPLGPVLGTPTGRAWFHEEDEAEMSGSATVGSTLRHLQQILSSLQKKGGWLASHIHLFGFSQGGSAAMHVALHCRGDSMLGSCVAVSAALLPQQLAELKQQRHQPGACSATPLLITHGGQDLELPRSRVDATVATAKQLGSGVRFHSIPGKAHAMIGSPSEMRHLMGFWAQALKHRPIQADPAQASHSTLVEVQSSASTMSSLQTGGS
ncbi:hypothetical protein ABBQ38_000465 [Trebouxia sp. C0009 RCD-2024]